MRAFLLPLFIAATGSAHAQCEDFQAIPSGTPISTIAGWANHSDTFALVGPTTGSNPSSKALRLNSSSTGIGFSFAGSEIPQEATSSFRITCFVRVGVEADVTIESATQTLAGLRITPNPFAPFGGTGAVTSLTNPSATVPALGDYATVELVGEAGGFITLSYNNQPLDQVAWPVSANLAEHIRFISNSTTSTMEVDDLCMAALQIGSIYCNSNANSTGVAAVVSAVGNSYVVANDVTLTMSSMPQFAMGYFLTSRTQGFTALPGGSQGNLCVTGSVGRFAGPGQVQNSGAEGSISIQIDLTAMPQATGSVPAVAGETWNFQGWHRDLVGGQVVSNFSDALAVMFQ